MPASYVCPRALMLHAPGQYSPGTSPTRASTPSLLTARVTSEAIHSKRSCVPSPAGQPHRRFEPGPAGRRHRRREARCGAVLLGEGELAGRAVQAKGLLKLPLGDREQDRLRDRGAVRRAVGKALADQPQRGFA